MIAVLADGGVTAQAVSIGTLIGVICAVIGVVYTGKSFADGRAADEQAERAKVVAAAVEAGRDEVRDRLQPQIDLLSAQLADSIRRGDAAQRRADTFETQYNNLRDRREGT